MWEVGHNSHDGGGAGFVPDELQSGLVQTGDGSTDMSSDVNNRFVRLGCAVTHRVEVPTSVVFQVRPARDQDVRVTHERLSFDPDVAMHHYLDLYGNLCSRVVLPPGPSTMHYCALAEVPDAVEEADEDASETPPGDLPDDVLHYTQPSRYCLPDVLADEARSRFGGLPPGYRRVQAICEHVHERPDLDGRDFAHLAISVCRALQIPARYVFGYLPDLDVPAGDARPGGSPSGGAPSGAALSGGAPMDFAAWLEVRLGDRWWTFDPRHGTRRKGRVVIGRGRDAADVAMVTTLGGPPPESVVVHAQEDFAPANR